MSGAVRLILVPTADRAESVLSLDTASRWPRGSTRTSWDITCERNAVSPSSLDVTSTTEFSYDATAGPLPSALVAGQSARKIYRKAATRCGFVVAKRAHR